MGEGAIVSGALALTQEADFSVADVTTTTVNQFVLLESIHVYLPSNNHALFHWAQCTFSHSVAGARVTFEVQLYQDDSETAQYLLSSTTNLYVAAANENYLATMSGGFNVQSNLPNMKLPGKRWMDFVVMNHTAGTLTIKAATDRSILHAFVAGDTT